MSVTNEPRTIRIPIEQSKEQIDAAAAFLSDVTGWPLIDCRYAARRMFEAAEKARPR